MLVFVDESGDTGFKIGRGSSPYFAVGAVIFADPGIALECDRAVARLKHALGWGSRREFHFNKVDDECRRALFEAAARFDFKIVGCVIDKAARPIPAGDRKHQLYETAMRETFQRASPLLSGATVVADATGSREFRREFNSFLKDWMSLSGRPAAVKRVRFERSHSNNLLQLADMCVGALARCFRSDVADPRSYWQLIESRSAGVALLPEVGPKKR